MTQVTINARTTAREPITITGTVTYLQIGTRRVRCLRHRDSYGRTVVTHYASGQQIINADRYDAASRSARLASGRSRAAPTEVQRVAVERLIEGLGVERALQVIDAAPKLN